MGGDDKKRVSLGRELKLGVLISGGGRTLLNLHERILAGTLSAKIAVVISSRADSAGVVRARNAGLPVEIVTRGDHPCDSFHSEIARRLASVDLVCLAGFLSLWRIPPEFAGRVLNIHPALLPAFGGRGMYGHHVHEAVLASRATESGCTVHFCDNEYDHGPILLQRRVPIFAADTPDTLAERVFEQECLAYPEAIQLVSDGRVHIEDRTVEIRP